MNICFIINNWQTLAPETDTTMRLIHESALRGHHVGIIYPQNLTIRNNITHAFAKILVRMDKVPENILTFYKKCVLKDVMLPVNGFDAVIMRKNPPLDPFVLNFLDSIRNEVFIMNDIDGLRKANNKLYTSSFYDPINSYIPITYVSKNKEYLKKVIDEHEGEKMILKPLDGYGGRGVIVIEKNAPQNINSLLDFYIDNKNYVILQEYISGAEKGDIRVLLLNGEPIGAYRRVPSKDDNRSNIHAGGSAEKYVLTPHDKALCRKIGKQLVSDGLYFVGLDLIEGKLLEVNVQSPGGITNINKLNKVKLQRKVLDFIEEKVDDREQYITKREAEIKRKLDNRMEILNA